MNYLPKTKISREHYNLLLNWRRINWGSTGLGHKYLAYNQMDSLPVELQYMNSPEEYYITLAMWINGEDVFEVIDEPQLLNNPANQTTLGDVIAELQEQFNQVGNIDVNVYDSDDHMVITYD